MQLPCPASSCPPRPGPDFCAFLAPGSPSTPNPGTQPLPQAIRPLLSSPPHPQHPYHKAAPSPTLPLPRPHSVPTLVSRLKSVFCVKGLSLWSHMVCHALRPPPSAVGRMVGGEVFRARGSHSPAIGKVVGACTSTGVLATDGVLRVWRGLSQRHIRHLILGWARDIQVSQYWRTSL